MLEARSCTLVLLWIAIGAVMSDWPGGPLAGLSVSDVNYEDMIDVLKVNVSHRGLHVRKFVRATRNALRARDDSARCVMCKSGTAFVKTQVRLGIEYEAVRDVLVPACEAAFRNLNTSLDYDLMCAGMLDNYMPDFWYIIGATSLKADEFCEAIHFCRKGEYDGCSSDEKPEEKTQRSPPRPITFRPPPPPRENALKVVQLADIHIDLEYETGSPTDCGYYLCCRDDYPGQGSARAWGDYTCNLPVRTLELFLRGIADDMVEPDLVLYTGDTPPHHVWEETQILQLNYSRVLAEILQRSLPGVPLYSTVGNHETYPTNLYYADRPEIEELNEYLADWWYEMSGFTDEQVRSMRAGAYYSVTARPGLRVLAYNTLFRLAYNFYSVLSGQHGAYVAMQAWMEDELQSAREAGDKVILLGHAPPGKGTSADLAPWLEGLVVAYAEVIVLHVYGHTHRDFFTLYKDGSGVARSVHLVSPSLTTLTDRNPSARIYWLDRDTFELLDYDHYILDIEQTSEDETTPPPIRYTYSPLDEYNMADLSPQSWQILAEALAQDNSTFHQYLLNYDVYRERPDDCDKCCRRRKLCEVNHLKYDDILECEEDENKKKKRRKYRVKNKEDLDFDLISLMENAFYESY